MTYSSAEAPRIAAIVYCAEDDVDTLLADFAFGRIAAGDRLGGIVQRNVEDAAGKKIDMQLIDLMTGEAIGISQTLGSGSGSCKLDASGLAASAQAVTRAVANGAALVVINKFSKQEATGHGLRNEFAEAIVAGRPLLTAVPEKCADAWRAFIGDEGAMLPCHREAIEAWWAVTAPRLVPPAMGNGSDDDWLWKTIC
jgi:nucleoside-triphosphatase THEP1